MASGSQYDSTNDTGSFASINHKTRLIESGTNIVAATKQGGGQEGYCNSTSAGMIRGYDYITDPSGTLWEKKIGRLQHAKWGTFYPLTTTIANNVSGIFGGVAATGTLAIAALDTTDGLTATFTTAASGGSQGGINRALLYTTRQFNPYFAVRCKLDENAANIRFYFGFTGSASAIGNSDDPLNALSGIGFSKAVASTNWRIFHNDASGATVSDDTGVALDTSYHTFEIWADDNATKFWWSLDGSTPTGVTTDIPAQTTSLSSQFLCTAVNADAKVMTVQGAVIASDK